MEKNKCMYALKQMRKGIKIMERSVKEYFEKIEAENMKKEKEDEKERLRLLQVCEKHSTY